MGNQSFQHAADTTPDPERRHSCRLQYTGRYHLPPKQLQDDYEVSSTVLGSGLSGSVVLARGRQSGLNYAVKTLRFQGVSEHIRQSIKREVEVFLGMDHPRIARLVDVYESSCQLRLVMECMEGGELFDRVVERGVFSEKDAADAVWQMLLALNYIHSHGVVHRDVKLENWMYQRKDLDHLKLIDFGFAKVWEPNTKLAASCGTLAYVAPEVLDKSYTSQCDLWSLGVVLFILLAGYMPFDGDDAQQIVMIKSGIYNMEQKEWSNVSESAKDLVRKLLVVDSSQRLTAEQALHHPWIEKRDQMQAATHAVDRTVVDALCRFARVSKFTRACMSMMAWSLTYEERLSVRDAFLELDQSRQGTIKLTELKKVLEEQFGVKDEEVARVFEALDSSHDHEVHYSQFLAAMASSRIVLHDGLLRATFRRFDTEGCGYITRGNLVEVLGSSFEGTEVDELLRDVDGNCDGQISYEEFIQYLRGDGAQEAHVEAATRLIDSELQRREEYGEQAENGADRTIDLELRGREEPEEQAGRKPPARRLASKLGGQLEVENGRAADEERSVRRRTASTGGEEATSADRPFGVSVSSVSDAAAS